MYNIRQIVIAIFTIAVVIFTGISASDAQETRKEKKGISKKAGVEGKGMHYWVSSFWSKVATVGKRGRSTIPTAVAGVKGAEQEKNKELTPYWKGKEKSKDGAAMTEIESLINQKDFAKAIDSLKSFRETYPDSPLKPIAILSLAYCYVEDGKTDEAKLVFEDFIKNYPDHELSADAKEGIELLKEQ